MAPASRGALRVLSHLPRASLDRLAGPLPDVEIVEVPMEGEPPPETRGEVLLTFAWGSPNLALLAERGVRWIHTIGTGVDRFPLGAVGDRILTCSRGASAIPIAEWTLAMLLAFEKRLPESWIERPPERWNQAELGGLAGRTLGLVGLGGIGTAVARRAQAFEMRVCALRRGGGPSPLAGVEMAGGLAELLAASDHVVIAASATPETRHLIGAEAFASLRPGAHLVNVSRGSLVDQEALRAALDSGRLARASLDVCEPEPLPAGHWLYTHPKVRLTPHISWSMPGAIPALVDTFIENLHRWIAGQPLERTVNVSLGY